MAVLAADARGNLRGACGGVLDRGHGRKQAPATGLSAAPITRLRLATVNVSPGPIGATRRWRRQVTDRPHNADAPAAFKHRGVPPKSEPNDRRTAGERFYIFSFGYGFRFKRLLTWLKKLRAGQVCIRMQQYT